MATGLLALPVELLESIHLLSGSCAFPCLNKAVHSHFNPTSSFSALYRANYITRRLALYSNLHIPRFGSGSLDKKIVFFLDAALKMPVCDMQVLEILEARCLVPLREAADRAVKDFETVEAAFKGKKDAPTEDVNNFVDAARKLQASDLSQLLGVWNKHAIRLPKRLFRSLPSNPKASRQEFDTSSLPLLKHLLHSLHADPDSSHGYALAKAVLARHFKLIRLLLEYGAKPSIKENLPVMLAIGRNDMEIVRVLVEQDYRSPEEDEQSSVEPAAEQQQSPKKGKKRLSSQTSSPSGRNGSSPGKRRRLEDRIKVTSGMLEQAVKQGYVPLIDYFMEKAAVPNMRTLAMLSR